jgi:hypothetical protein
MRIVILDLLDVVVTTTPTSNSCSDST